MASMAQTQGKCEKCGEAVSERAGAEHALGCFSGAGRDYYVVFLKSPDWKQFWMFAALRGDSSLEDLDELLRDKWMECCGHLSMFTTPSVRYLSQYMEFAEEGEVRMKDAKIARVLKPGMEMDYEYDFGSTTGAQIRVMGKAALRVKKKAAVLVRNEMPFFPCAYCGEKSHWIQSDGSFKTVCKKCSRKEGEEEEMLLPLVNSPRIGTCGFRGKPY